MKIFTYSTIYRGQQIEKQVCAKTIKEAAYKLNINTYTVNKYALKTDANYYFDNVLASFDSGMLWHKRKDLIRVKMPLERLLSIIDSYKDK